MSRSTKSEKLFERFCEVNGLASERVQAGDGKRPNYKLWLGGRDVYFEIEQIESSRGIDSEGVWSRTVGWHIRKKIDDARGQAKYAAGMGSPVVLLVYNTVDPMQMFGTEAHDFVCAMYGELTLKLVGGRIVDQYHGRRAKLRADANKSLSAMGHLSDVAGAPTVVLYENVHAQFPLPFEAMPACFGMVRVEGQEGDAAQQEI